MKNIIFCGFGKLGLDCLNKLIVNGYNIKYVFTHKTLEENSVDLFCKNNNLIFFYSDMRKEKDKYIDLLNSCKMDYLISVNYRYILPKYIFEIPDFSINIHGSLLPKYRGRTPHVWSIINGEKISGITAHLIVEGVDEGDIILQKEIFIEPEDTGYTLLQKYEKEYPNLLMDSLKKIENKENLRAQDESKATYFGKRIPEMGYIDFFKQSQQIIDFVRAQAYPYPGAFYYSSVGQKVIINKISKINDKSIKIEEIGLLKEIEGSIYVKCLDGILKLNNYEIL